CRAIEVWEQGKAPDADTSFDRAWALAQLAGLGTDAKSGVRAEEATRFAEQAMTALRAVVAAGWRQRAELNDPDFDPPRKREDFQKMVKELETKSASVDRASPDNRP